MTPTDTNRGSAVVFEGNETDASVLDGFTITGGTGSRLVDSSVSVDSWVGGGIFFDASSGTVRNCAIVQNRVENSGGGVFCGYLYTVVRFVSFAEEPDEGNPQVWFCEGR